MTNTTDPYGNVALAERLGVGCYDFEVVSSAMATPAMRRLLLTSGTLGEFVPLAGQDLMFTVETADGGVTRRRYTICSYDPAARVVEVQIVAHGNGPGAHWAATCQPGDHIEAIGPRGKVLVDPTADWHLFAGDATFLPATMSMVASLGAETRAIAVLEVDSPEDQQPLNSSAKLDGPHWVNPPASVQMLDLLEHVDFPPGRGHAYIGGEAQFVRAAKDLLVARSMSPDDINAKPYWRAGAANAGNGEPDR